MELRIKEGKKVITLSDSDKTCADCLISKERVICAETYPKVFLTCADRSVGHGHVCTKIEDSTNA